MTTRIVRHRIPLTTLVLIVVGALAFTAGRLSLVAGGEAVASPVASPVSSPEMTPQDVREITPQDVRGMTPQDVRGMTPQDVLGMTPQDVLDMAPDPTTPGKQHEVLNVLVGAWDATFKLWADPGMAPETSQGTVTREWVLDGRYIKETVEAQTPFGMFRGMGFLGYNNVDGVYELVWMDNQATAISVERGTFNTARRIMTTRGEHRDPGSGHIINTWGTMDLSNPIRHVYQGYTITESGEEMKVYEGVLQKR